MNIIEQIDDKFRAKFASDYCEVVLTNGEWQQIKEAFAKVREDAERYTYLRRCIEQQSFGLVGLARHLDWHPKTFDGGMDAAIDAARSLKDGE